MSVKIMSMVFEHYPEGGGELLLALALADFADDDGGSIYPSIPALARKTRQSERSVQYQLRAMEKSGFLSVVRSSRGGRINGQKYRSNEYRINPWFLLQNKNGEKTAPLNGTLEQNNQDNGAEIAPIPQSPINTGYPANGEKTAPLSISTKDNGAEIAPIPQSPINTGYPANGEKIAPLNGTLEQNNQDNGAEIAPIKMEERCKTAHLTVQNGTLNGATAVAPNPSYKPPYNPPPQRARAHEAQPNPTGRVVVVDDLVFPARLPPEERAAILNVLENSEIHPGAWQPILDELAGAMASRTVHNPVGFVRGISVKATNGAFTPETGIAVRRRRDDANKPSPTLPQQQSTLTPQEALERLPLSMQKILRQHLRLTR